MSAVAKVVQYLNNPASHVLEQNLKLLLMCLEKKNWTNVSSALPVYGSNWRLDVLTHAET